MMTGNELHLQLKIVLIVCYNLYLKNVELHKKCSRNDVLNESQISPFQDPSATLWLITRTPCFNLNTEEFTEFHRGKKVRRFSFMVCSLL
jgi:hypothetical protein